jgi:hypothetical protein
MSQLLRKGAVLYSGVSRRIILWVIGGTLILSFRNQLPNSLYVASTVLPDVLP